MKRSASAPKAGRPLGNFFLSSAGSSSGLGWPWMMSSGSMTLPFTFDIFSPRSSRTIACKKTVRKGTSPMKCSPNIIIRATQKKMMSWPVSMTVVG